MKTFALLGLLVQRWSSCGVEANDPSRLSNGGDRAASLRDEVRHSGSRTGSVRERLDGCAVQIVGDDSGGD